MWFEYLNISGHKNQQHSLKRGTSVHALGKNSIIILGVIKISCALTNVERNFTPR